MLRVGRGKYLHGCTIAFTNGTMGLWTKIGIVVGLCTKTFPIAVVLWRLPTVKLDLNPVLSECNFHFIPSRICLVYIQYIFFH